MYFILKDGIKLKKWAGALACCTTEETRNPFPLRPEDYALLKSCDGMTDLPASDALRAWEAMGVIRQCQKGETHLAEGQIREYPSKLSGEDFSMTPEEYYDYAIEFAKKYRESGLTIPVRLWQVLALNGHDKVYHIVPVKASQSTFCEYEMTCPDILKKLSVYFTYCQGGCPAVGLLFDGSPLGTDIYKCLFFEKGYYRKVSNVMKGWKNLLPLTEAEERLLSGEA